MCNAGRASVVLTIAPEKSAVRRSSNAGGARQFKEQRQRLRCHFMLGKIKENIVEFDMEFGEAFGIAGKKISDVRRVKIVVMAFELVKRDG